MLQGIIRVHEQHRRRPIRKHTAHVCQQCLENILHRRGGGQSIEHKLAGDLNLLRGKFFGNVTENGPGSLQAASGPARVSAPSQTYTTSVPRKHRKLDETWINAGHELFEVAAAFFSRLGSDQIKDLHLRNFRRRVPKGLKPRAIYKQDPAVRGNTLHQFTRVVEDVTQQNLPVA